MVLVLNVEAEKILLVKDRPLHLREDLLVRDIIVCLRLLNGLLDLIEAEEVLLTVGPTLELVLIDIANHLHLLADHLPSLAVDAEEADEGLVEVVRPEVFSSLLLLLLIGFFILGSFQVVNSELDL